MKPIRSVHVWWNPNTDSISLGEFLVMCAREFCHGKTKTVDLMVDRTFVALSTKNTHLELPPLYFRVSRENDTTIIERTPR